MTRLPAVLVLLHACHQPATGDTLAFGAPLEPVDAQSVTTTGAAPDPHLDPDSRYRVIEIYFLAKDAAGNQQPVVGASVYGFCDVLQMLTPSSSAMEQGQEDGVLWKQEWAGTTDSAGRFVQRLPNCEWKFFAAKTMPDGSLYLGWDTIPKLASSPDMNDTTGLDVQETFYVRERAIKKLELDGRFAHTHAYVRPSGYPIFLRTSVPTREASGAFRTSLTARLSWTNDRPFEIWGQGYRLSGNHIVSRFVYDWGTFEANPGTETLASPGTAAAEVDLAWQPTGGDDGELTAERRRVWLSWSREDRLGLEGAFAIQLAEGVGSNYVRMTRGDYVLGYERQIAGDSDDAPYRVSFKPLRYPLTSSNERLSLRFNDEFRSVVMANHWRDTLLANGQSGTNLDPSFRGYLVHMVTVDRLNGHPVSGYYDAHGNRLRAEGRVRVRESASESCYTAYASQHEHELVRAGADRNPAGQAFYLLESDVGELPDVDRACWKVFVPFGGIGQSAFRPTLKSVGYESLSWLWEGVDDPPPGYTTVRSPDRVYVSVVPALLEKAAASDLAGLSAARARLDSRGTGRAESAPDSTRVFFYPAISGQSAGVDRHRLGFADLVSRDLARHRKTLHEVGHSIGLGHGGAHEYAACFGQITEGRYHIGAQRTKYVYFDAFWDNVLPQYAAGFVRTWRDSDETSSCWGIPGGHENRYYQSLYHHGRQLAERRNCRYEGLRGADAFDRYVFDAENVLVATSSGNDRALNFDDCDDANDVARYEVYTLAVLNAGTGADFTVMASFYGIEAETSAVTEAIAEIEADLGGLPECD